MNKNFRQANVLILLVIANLAAIGYWWQRSLPVPIPDAPPGKIHCLSYSPYRLTGDTPFDKNFVVSPQRVAEDFVLLAPGTRCVRTYSVQQGLGDVPESARRAGLKVWLGIWIGRDAVENRLEIALAIDLAQRYPDVIEALIVGNEVLLRREQTPTQLAALIAEVRAATRLPVTYADVWEFWLRNPSLAQSVDFITVHMLPYWEDDPIAVTQAAGHAMSMVELVQAAFPGKEIVVGEAGWPSAGRWRRGAAPSLVNEARFLREFANQATTRGLRYNLFEAFDQPWKRGQEGAMGGHWGMFDSAGRPKFRLTGAVIEDEHWRRGWAAASFGALGFAILAWARRVRRPTGMLVAALAGGGVGGVLWAQWLYLWLWNRYVVEWLVTASYTCAALLLSAIIALDVARWTSGAAAKPAALVAPLRAMFLFGAAVMSLLLVVDARYRGFPLPLHLAPAIGLAVHAYGFGAGRISTEERVLALWLAASAPYIVWQEGIENLPALMWAGLAMLYALPVLSSMRPFALSTSTPRVKPTAENS